MMNPPPEEEEDTGPSVDSTDAEERIAARRIRIQKRIELQRRAQMGEDPNEKKEIKEELTKSRKQMEQSRLRLTKLKKDGFDLVTNIRIAGDSRESRRRVEEEEQRRQRKDRLEAEAKAGSERFDEITRKWESALQKEIPQDLQEMLLQQKQSCDAMIDEKNKLINDFQMELKSKDDQYVKDLKKQAEDIDLMIERMDEQVKQLTHAYREELNQIERSFVAERTELSDLHKKKWEATMQARRDKEQEYMDARSKRVEDYEQQLQHLRVQDAEEYNMAKIKLETDVQILQQQLQQMKATYQLNQEKLEYNFNVLRKRDEENTITKSQQKRKITRLQDVLTNLKAKLAKQEKMYKDENTQLTEDYKRITEQFKELQKKSKHFMATDAKKFREVWIMNEEECKELLRKVLEQDRLIHEHQLGLDWESPNVDFMENVGPICTEEKKQTVSAQQVVSEILAATSGERTPGGGGEGGPPGESEAGAGSEQMTEEQRSLILQKYSPQLVKLILELLCDESGFLIESKLAKLLSPLERDERSLMKLDAIFTALQIETEDDIHLLAGYFLREVESAGRRKDSGGFIGGSDDEEGEGGQSPAAAGEEGEGDEELAGLTPGAEDRSQELIHPNEVLKALRAFVEENKQPPKDKKHAGQFQIMSQGDRDDTDDSAYWKSYPGALDENKMKLWTAMLQGSEQYSDMLKNRASLITETDGLRQQNAELRMLLHQYVNSKVNQELEVPPTRILQLELNPPSQ